MLIQKVARSDSIVAARMHPADFCNNIGTSRTLHHFAFGSERYCKADIAGDFQNPKLAEPGAAVCREVDWGAPAGLAPHSHTAIKRPSCSHQKKPNSPNP